MIQKGPLRCCEAFFLTFFLVTAGELSGAVRMVRTEDPNLRSNWCDGPLVFVKRVQCTDVVTTDLRHEKNLEKDGDILMMECNIHICICIYIYIFDTAWYRMTK